MQRILLTGSRGFLGSRVKALLQAQGRPVTPFVGDLRDPDGFRSAVGQASHEVDVVIHAAALITHNGEVSADDYWQVNVAGTQNLLEAYPHQKFVFVSTADVQRPNLSPYAQSKLQAEALVQARSRHCIVRLVSLFGPAQRQASKLIPKLLRQHFLGNVAFDVCDDIRRYCFVDDAATAIIKAIDEEGIIQGPHTEISNHDLADLVVALSHKLPPASVNPTYQSLYRHLGICAQALRSEEPGRDARML